MHYKFKIMLFVMESMYYSFKLRAYAYFIQAKYFL